MKVYNYTLGDFDRKTGVEQDNFSWSHDENLLNSHKKLTKLDFYIVYFDLSTFIGRRDNPAQSTLLMQ